jgi:hypothetical protein
MVRLAVTMTALALLLAGCSPGDGEDAPEATQSTQSTPAAPAYFADVAAWTAAIDEENTAADNEMNDAIATTPPRAIGDRFALVTRESAARLDDRLTELEALEPPADAAGAHEALLTASRALAEESRGFAARLEGVHGDDLGGVEAPASFTEAEFAVDTACESLQTRADEAGADVDLCVGLFAR